MEILVINAGSSSIKYKLYAFPHQCLIHAGTITNIGERYSSIQNHNQAIGEVFNTLMKNNVVRSLKEIAAVGHRVVHGGEAFKKPVVINESVIRKIRENIRLAPLHNPANLEGILACKKMLKDIPQVAVFDTAFHQSIPDYAYMYAIPMKYYARYRVRKYGFHGISHQYVAEKAAALMKKPLHRLKLITCHLGNGCSITAVKNGKSVDTSMGFTPLEGLMMGTRCGDIDPAIVGYLMKEEMLSVGAVDTVLNKMSGLLGVSGISNDMREIRKRLKTDPRARLAWKMFVYRIKKYVGMYLYILGGADAIVFTAGIGENNPDMIREITAGVSNLAKKKIKILTIPTDEEKMIGTLTYHVMKRFKKNNGIQPAITITE